MIAVMQNSVPAATNANLRLGRMRQRRLQTAGLKRLITVLEHAATQAAGQPLFVAPVYQERPGQLARLRAAHAAYALASSPMERSGFNGWLSPRSSGSEVS